MSVFEPFHQAQPRVAQPRLVGHHQHIVEELRHGRSEPGGFGKRLPEALAGRDGGVDRRLALVDLREQRDFGRLAQHGAIVTAAGRRRRVEIPRDVAHALEENRQLPEVRRLGELRQHFELAPGL